MNISTNMLSLSAFTTIRMKMVSLPTVLMKFQWTGPFSAKARKTFTIALQHTNCILGLYWGKLSICTTMRCSRTGVYTSGTYQKWRKNSKLEQGINIRTIYIYSNLLELKWPQVNENWLAILTIKLNIYCCSYQNKA